MLKETRVANSDLKRLTENHRDSQALKSIVETRKNPNKSAEAHRDH